MIASFPVFGVERMIATSAARADVAALSETAAFNRWAGFEVVEAGEGRAELKLAWRADLGQYAGFLHASIIGGMIDTACGFAAFTLSGHVLASHISVNCLAPAKGDAFLARARVVKAGRRQVFAHAELFAVRGDGEHLVATGDVILVPFAADADAAPAQTVSAPSPTDASVR
jgi:uncharacterized protein (TIGR00369 family)